MPQDEHSALLKRALGMALVAIRNRRKLQQQEVAIRVGTTRSHLSLLETGFGDPKLSMIWRLAAVLEVSPVLLVREVWTYYRELRNTIK